jgi:hypothetical protein
VVGFCDCGNEPSGSMKCGEFIDKLTTCQLLRKDSKFWCFARMSVFSATCIDHQQGFPTLLVIFNIKYVILVVIAAQSDLIFLMINAGQDGNIFVI